MKDTAQLLQELQSMKWHYVHKRVRSPLYQYFLFEGISRPYNKKIPFAYPIAIGHIDGDLAFVDAMYQNLKTISQTELQKDGGFLTKLLKSSYEENEITEQWARNLEEKDFLNTTKEEIVAHWQTYIEKIYHFGSYVVLPLFLEEYLEKQLKQEVEKKFPAVEVAEVYQILTTPMKLGVIQQEEENLLRIAIKKVSGDEVIGDIQKHLREFAWIKNNKFDGSFYTAEEISVRVDTLSQNDPEKHLAQYLDKIQSTQAKFTKYRNMFLDNDAVIAIIDTLQESIYFRSWRTERYYRNAYFLQGLFKKTAELLNLGNAKDIFFLTAPEIMNGLTTDFAVDLNKIRERKDGYVLYSDTKDIYIFSGTDREMFLGKVKLNPVEMTNVIKGQVAYPGYAKGRAVVVTSIPDLKKVQQGDILVSLSTTPDFVPVLKHVIAIVTEEGGVLSHASVISRELHIPCVIGTKVATKILKDGDIIEVDANKGVVTIIK